MFRRTEVPFAASIASRTTTAGRKAGGHISFGSELSEASLLLDARYGIAGARTEADLAVLVEAQAQVP